MRTRLRAAARAASTRFRAAPRRSLGAVAGVAVLGVLLVGGAAQVRVDTSTEQFLAAGDPAIAEMQARARDFGGDPVVVLLRTEQPRELLTRPDRLLALLRLEGELARIRDVAAVLGPATTLNQLAGAGQNLLAQIAGRRDGARIAAEDQATRAGRSPQDVARAGQEAVGAVDRRYAPLVVRGLPVGLPTLDNPAFAGAVIYGPDGAPRPQWRYLVPDDRSVAVSVRPREDLDQAGTATLVDAVRAAVDAAALPVAAATVSGVPAVTAGLTAQVVREIPLISALAAVIVLLRFLLVPGVARRRWWPLGAVLLGGAATLAVFGWTGHPLSFGAVALLPLLLGVGSSFPLYLATVRDRRTVLVTAAASAAAFAALGLSPLPFVRDLGLSLALGVGFTVAAALAVGPRPDHDPPPTAVAVPPPAPRTLRMGALVAAVAVAAGGWAVLPRLDVESDPQQLASGLSSLDDARVVEEALGSSGEIGVVLRGPDVLTPEAMAWAGRTQEAVVTGFGDRVRPVVGVPDLFAFLGTDPSPAEVTAALRLVPPYLSSTVVTPDRGSGVQVFGLRVSDVGAQAELLDRVRAALPTPPAGFTAELVGLPVAAGTGYRALLDDRYPVNLAGILAAGLVLAAGLRHRADALRAALTGIVATGAGFAVLWVAGMTLSPLTVGLGALVTVTGCEFVVLLALARRLGSARLRRSVAAAGLTSVAGYLVLVVSELRLVREFGLVLGVAVALSYLAAVLVGWCLPPAGRDPADRDPADRDPADREPVEVDR